MDLEGIKRKLTEGYERINKMKNSTSKIEVCRTRLKAKGDKALEDVHTMMNNIAQKLCQLQQSIETTIKNTVAERESQLDAKKREIHDGYASLVKICVEADKVLRGKNVDLLGRSCQRLFCKFEAANIKLDASEKIDTEGLIGFAFQDNSKQFLSSVYVARLQHFKRYGKLAEIDEFWVDYQNADDMLDKTDETSCMISVPNHTDCFSSRPVTIHRSPDRSASISPTWSLETIHEVPEDTSPVKVKVDEVKRRPEIVHIREDDLCANRCHMESYQVSGIKNCLLESLNFVPPPPGFSKLKETSFQNSGIQQYGCQQPKLGFGIIQKLGLEPGSQADSDVHFTNGCLDRGNLEKVSRSDTSLAFRVPVDASSCAAFKPIRLYSASVQKAETWPKDEDKVLCKLEDGSRDEDDFIWESDDSVDFQHSELGPLSKCKAETDKSRLNSGTAHNFPWQVNSGVEKMEQQKPICLTSERNCTNKQTSSSTSSVNLNRHQQSAEKLNSVKEELHNGREVNGHCLEAKPMDIKWTAVIMAQQSLKAEPVDTKQTALTMAQWNLKAESVDTSKKAAVMATAVAKAGHSLEAEPVDTSKQAAVTVTRHCLTAESVDTKHTGVTVTEITEKPEQVEPKEIKPVSSPADVKQKEEGAPVKTTEVPRPVKTRSKRLDLSQMLLHIGGGVFVIQAKCIEKIRGDFDHPIGVCTNSKGDVIVADTNNHIIKVCNNGRVISKFGAELRMRRPSAVVVSGKDEIFVKDDSCLYHFDAQGQLIKAMGKRMMNAPYGLGMTNEGKLIVVDALYSNGRIHVFQQDGAIDTYPYQPLRSQHDDSKCRFLAVHGEDVLTSDLGRSCLYLTNQKGELQKTIGWRGKRNGELNEPAGVAVDSVGNWVVADSKNHRVQVFAQNGYFMATLYSTGESIRRPSGIHLTSDGLLYVINYLDSVIKVFKLGAC